MPNVAHAAGGGNDRRSHTAEEAAAGVCVAMDAWLAAARPRHPISRCVIGHRVRRQSYQRARAFIRHPEARRSERIRDLHERVELTRSRIAAPKEPLAGMTG